MRTKLANLDVLFVSNALGNGGAARVLGVLANDFCARGLRVGVAVYQALDQEYLLQANIGKEYGPQGNDRAAKAKRVLWLRNIVKNSPGAVVIAFEYFVNMQAVIACMGRANKLIISERNDPSKVGVQFGAIREHLYRRADMLVCQTDEAAAYFSEKVKKCVILNPVKEGLPEPYEGVRRKAVVSFCRLEQQKNLPMLVRAFANFHEEFPEYMLEIYGDGKERNALLELIDSLGLSGCAHIYPGRSDVHTLVRDAMMFVLPSNYEGLSNSMLEAMAIGLPTICTDCPCGGARMVIDDGVNGLLVSVGDCTGLADGMKAIASDGDLAERMASNAFAIRYQLDVGSISSQWLEIVEQ